MSERFAQGPSAATVLHAVPNPAPAPDDVPALLTVEEAARQLRIGRTTCFKLVSAGEIESVMVGWLRRVPPDAVTAYVAKLRRFSVAA